MEKQDVLFIINGLVKSGGKVGISGGDVRLAEIAKSAPGIRVSLLTTSNGIEFAKKMGIPYEDAYVLKQVVTSGIMSNLTISLRSFFSLPKGARSFKGTVYSSCEHLYDVLPALRLKLFNHCRWLAVYHWVEEYPWKDKRGGTPPLRRYAYWLNRWFSGFLIKMFADQVLGVSEVTRDKLINIKGISPEKVKAVYCGVNLDEIESIHQKYKKEAGTRYDGVYMKRLNNGKGIWDLLEIWKQVVAKRPNSKLAVIGDGPEELVASLKTFIHDNKLDKNIQLLGVIYDVEEKFRVINQAKLFVLPSHEENWAIVIGEAMACHLPVVAYDLKEIHPIWKENVAWVPFADVPAFAEKVIELLEDDDACRQRAKEGFDFIHQYDWKQIAFDEFAS